MILEKNWKEVLNRIEDGWVVIHKKNMYKCISIDKLHHLYSFVHIGYRNSGTLTMDLSSYEENKNIDVLLVRDFVEACRVCTNNKIKKENMYDPSIDSNAPHYIDDWVFMHSETGVFLCSESRNYKSCVLRASEESILREHLGMEIIDELQQSWLYARFVVAGSDLLHLTSMINVYLHPYIYGNKVIEDK